MNKHRKSYQLPSPLVLGTWYCSKTFNWIIKTCKILNKGGRTNGKMSDKHINSGFISLLLFAAISQSVESAQTTTENKFLSQAIKQVGNLILQPHNLQIWQYIQHLQKAIGIYINQLMVFKLLNKKWWGTRCSETDFCSDIKTSSQHTFWNLPKFH